MLFRSESAIIDLYSYQRDLLGEERLSALFPGWLEDGKLIPWMYHPAGRHVIEPADMVPLGANYTAQVKIRWYDTDTGAVTRSQDDAADGLAVVSLLLNRVINPLLFVMSYPDILVPLPSVNVLYVRLVISVTAFPLASLIVKSNSGVFSF